MRVSDDGRTLFTSNPMNAYDVKTGRLVWHAPRAAGLDVHDGHVAVPAADGSRVQILDASDGRTIRTLTGNQGAVVDLVFSPNGATLAATAERRDRHRVGRSVGPDRTPPPDGRRARHRVLRLRRHGLHGRKPAGFAARLGPAGPTQLPDPARARGLPASLRGLGAGQYGRLVGVDVQDGAREARAQVGKPPAGRRGPRGRPGRRLARRRRLEPGCEPLRVRRRQRLPESRQPGGRIAPATQAGHTPARSSTSPMPAPIRSSHSPRATTSSWSMPTRLAVRTRVTVPAVPTGVTANARLAVVTSAASEGGTTWRVPVTRVAPGRPRGGTRRR